MVTWTIKQILKVLLNLVSANVLSLFVRYLRIFCSLCLGLRHIVAREAARIDRSGASQLVQAYTTDPTLLAFADLFCSSDHQNTDANEKVSG